MKHLKTAVLDDILKRMVSHIGVPSTSGTSEWTDHVYGKIATCVDGWAS